MVLEEQTVRSKPHYMCGRGVAAFKELLVLGHILDGFVASTECCTV